MKDSNGKIRKASSPSAIIGDSIFFAKRPKKEDCPPKLVTIPSKSEILESEIFLKRQNDSTEKKKLELYNPANQATIMIHNSLDSEAEERVLSSRSFTEHKPGAPLPLKEIAFEDLAPIIASNSSFSKFMETNSLFIDNTEKLSKIILNPNSFFLLARPRRMGKSLLLSTIAEIYSSGRDRFKGTRIGELSKEFWNKIGKFPIIHFEAPDYYDEETLNELWDRKFRKCARKHGIKLDEKKFPAEKFDELLTKVAEKSPSGKCVVLIDEYNQAITTAISLGIKEATLEKMRLLNHNIYKSLKQLEIEKKIEKCFITGCSKIGKFSIWSGLNQVIDISENPNYADIVGIPKSQIETNHEIRKYIQFIAQKVNLEKGNGKLDDMERTMKEIIDQLLKHYNGYQFSKNDKAKIINPFSFLQYLSFAAESPVELLDRGKLKMENFWNQSGCPTRLLKSIENFKPRFMQNLAAGYLTTIHTKKLTSPSDIENYSSDYALQLYQAGYLTIKGLKQNPETGTEEYLLDFPNEEVKNGFTEELMDIWIGKQITQFMANIKKGKFEHVFEAIYKLCKIKKIRRDENEAGYQSLISQTMRDQILDTDYLAEQVHINDPEDTKKIRIPDILWITKDEMQRVVVNIFELRVGKKRNKGTPEDREYIRYAKSSTDIYGLINQQKLTFGLPLFRTLFLMFNEGTIDYMKVQESSESTKEGIADRYETGLEYEEWVTLRNSIFTMINQL